MGNAVLKERYNSSIYAAGEIASWTAHTAAWKKKDADFVDCRPTTPPVALPEGLLELTVMSSTNPIQRPKPDNTVGGGTQQDLLLLTQHSQTISIRIKNFPYLRERSRLAVKFLVASDVASAKSLLFDRRRLAYRRAPSHSVVGYFEWQAKARTLFPG